MSEKQKVTLYLNSANYVRLRKLVDSVPGMSVSGVVDELIEDFIPPVEELLAMARSGDTAAQAEMMSRLLADQLLNIAGEGTSVIRQITDSTRDEGKDA